MIALNIGEPECIPCDDYQLAMCQIPIHWFQIPVSEQSFHHISTVSLVVLYSVRLLQIIRIWPGTFFQKIWQSTKWSQCSVQSAFYLLINLLTNPCPTEQNHTEKAKMTSPPAKKDLSRQTHRLVKNSGRVDCIISVNFVHRLPYMNWIPKNDLTRGFCFQKRALGCYFGQNFDLRCEMIQARVVLSRF